MSRAALSCSRILLACALFVATPAACDDAAAGRVAVTDLEGQPVELFGPGGAAQEPLALVFLASECPVSNRYAPELARLCAEYAPRGVRFFRVYPDAADDAASALQHGQDFSLSFPALLDGGHVLVERAGVGITPEVAVFDAGERVYRGRIDDRWLALNESRPEPTRRDLALALDAVLAGGRPQVERTEAVGCLIQR